MNINKSTICRGGFSLTEMLIATGIMAIGLVLVATIFPVGVKLTTMTTERSIAAVAADEAFAKVRLYGVRDAGLWPTPGTTSCNDFMYVIRYDADNDGDVDIDDAVDDWSQFAEFYYPTVPGNADGKYCWSALCRQVDMTTPKDVQVTVFVSRMMASGLSYYNVSYDSTGYHANKTAGQPQPVYVNVQFNANNDDPAPPRKLVIKPAGVMNQKWNSIEANSFYKFFDEGGTIVNNRDGRIYQIEEMRNADNSADGSRETIILRQDWRWDNYDNDPLNSPATAEWATIWLVPPAVGSSRYPCVGVYQKIIRFD